LLGTVVLGSAIGLAYYLRVIAAIHAAPEPGDRPLRAHRGGAVTVAFALIAVLAIGLWPQPLLAVLQQATVAHLP
jgi:NADH-quinone oxidoreductase subunit N